MLDQLFSLGENVYVVFACVMLALVILYSWMNK